MYPQKEYIMSNMKKINVYLPTRQIEGLTHIAKCTGVKFSEHLRRALDAYLKDQAKDFREGAYSFEPQPRPKGESDGITTDRDR
jgi:hypothetical protein